MVSVRRWIESRVAWLRSPELRLLAALAFVGLLVLGFIILGDEVAEGETMKFDRAILMFFRNTPADPVGSRGVEATVMHISALGSAAVTTIVTLIAVGYLALAGRRRFAALVLACAVGTEVWMWLLKTLYARPRPTMVTPLDPLASNSFPSGHSMISTALYLTLAVLISRALPTRRLRIFAVATGALLAFMIGTSRVYLGVHYPTDVLAGWSIGLAWALICGLIARWLGGKGKVEAPGPAADTAA
jgi:undecaprenyl-diphosphatase